MSILVNTHNEEEEQLLMAFLKNHSFDYKLGITSDEESEINAFLDQYNRELEEGDKDIDAGNGVSHEDVKKLFADRLKS